MAKIDIKNSAPMRALAAAKVKYSDFFRAADRIYKDPDAKWDKSICYCPVGLGVTYAVDLADLDSPTLAERGEISRTGATLAVLASWRKAKSIYTLDEDLEAELFKTSSKDMTVAPGMLTIPEWCIFVKTKLLQGCSGLFIMFDHDIQRGHKELYISAVTEDGKFMTSFYLILPDKPQKLTEILKGEEAVVRAKDVSKTPELAPYVSSYFKASRQAIRFTINLLLYLSAVNAEVKQVNKLSFRRQGRIKDTPREVAVYSVGEATGYRIRRLNRYVREHGEPQGGHHRSPVMHVRRAHWHTFAYGPSKSLRRVKWLPPIIVNGDGEEMDIPTITELPSKEN